MAGVGLVVGLFNLLGLVGIRKGVFVPTLVRKKITRFGAGTGFDCAVARYQSSLKGIS